MNLIEMLWLIAVAGCQPLNAQTAQTAAPAAPAGPTQPTVATGAGAPVVAVRPPALFGIGGGERDRQTHIAFETPKNLISASVHVVIDRTAGAGLNFFALQVDFENATWAHGGVQDVDGPDGTRTHQINWGGLVDRGGGTADYEEENDLVDLDKIQNPPVGRHVGPYAWKTGVEYEYVVERGGRITLPPGDYRLIPGKPLVHVDHPRQMWEWRFTVKPVSEPGAPFVAVLYDAAPTFTAFYVWNESGYGSTDAAQHTSWWAPRYTAVGGTPQPAGTWSRF